MVIVVLCGCDVKGNARWLDDKAGKVLSIFEDQGNTDSGAGGADKRYPDTREDLSQGERSRIEEWLQDNGFNRYGDPQDTVYASGTPLFDEQTGRTLERFQYILDQHPDILDKIGSGG